jgi:hypothetical protein
MGKEVKRLHEKYGFLHLEVLLEFCASMMTKKASVFELSRAARSNDIGCIEFSFVWMRTDSEYDKLKIDPGESRIEGSQISEK